MPPVFEERQTKWCTLKWSCQQACGHGQRDFVMLLRKDYYPRPCLESWEVSLSERVLKDHTSYHNPLTQNQTLLCPLMPAAESKTEQWLINACGTRWKDTKCPRCCRVPKQRGCAQSPTACKHQASLFAASSQLKGQRPLVIYGRKSLILY